MSNLILNSLEIRNFRNFEHLQKEDGLLIRLESKQNDVVATLFDERTLGIATRAHIEVR